MSPPQSISKCFEVPKCYILRWSTEKFNSFLAPQLLLAFQLHGLPGIDFEIQYTTSKMYR